MSDSPWGGGPVLREMRETPLPQGALTQNRAAKVITNKNRSERVRPLFDPSGFSYRAVRHSFTTWDCHCAFGPSFEAKLEIGLASLPKHTNREVDHNHNDDRF
jgi:hypothetical protein